jgi:exoribonuclease-2
VRPKDISLLHPGPLRSLAELTPVTGDLQEAWELVSDGSTDLAELSELIYGEFTPATAWATWQQVADGIYFEGTPERILARDAARVQADIEARQRKEAAKRDWEGLLDRLRKEKIEPGDHERLQEVEQLALGRTEHSRILQALGHQENPVSAHRLLLKLGYWEPSCNPYPLRHGLPVANPDLPLPGLPEEERLDLTGLASYAIDDEGSEDPDDAISLDGDLIWVHVADVAALVTPDSALDQEAHSRSANLYLPEGIVHMLPPPLTGQLGLGLQARSPALSFGFRLDDENRVTDLRITPSWVRVTRRHYAEVEKQLDQEPFATLLRLARGYQARRMAAGAAALDLPEVSVRVAEDGEIRIRPMQRLASREMVTELMLMTGEAVAAYALANDIPLPFVIQQPPDNPQVPQGLAAMYAYRRKLRPSKCNTLEGPHAGLGLDAYTRVTSPLRRYLDLVTHQQLRAFLRRQPMIPVAEISKRIAVADLATSAVRRAERLSNLHWKLLYLKQRPWQGTGVVVQVDEQRTTRLIPELGMETRLRLSRPPSLDSELQLAVREVDLPDQMAWFRLLKNQG